MKLKALQGLGGSRFNIRPGQVFETDDAEGKRLVKAKIATPAKGTEKAVLNISGREQRKVEKRAVAKASKAAKKTKKKAAKRRRG